MWKKIKGFLIPGGCAVLGIANVYGHNYATAAFCFSTFVFTMFLWKDIQDMEREAMWSNLFRRTRSITFAPLLALTLFAGIQDRPAVDTTHEVSAAAQAKILKLQLQQRTIENNYTTCQAVIEKSPQEFQVLQAQVEAAKTAAVVEAKLKPEEWDVDVVKFEFVKRPVKPVEKKP